MVKCYYFGCQKKALFYFQKKKSKKWQNAKYCFQHGVEMEHNIFQNKAYNMYLRSYK